MTGRQGPGLHSRTAVLQTTPLIALECHRCGSIRPRQHPSLNWGSRVFLLRKRFSRGSDRRAFLIRNVSPGFVRHERSFGRSLITLRSRMEAPGQSRSDPGNDQNRDLPAPQIPTPDSPHPEGRVLEIPGPISSSDRESDVPGSPSPDHRAQASRQRQDSVSQTFLVAARILLTLPGIRFHSVALLSSSIVPPLTPLLFSAQILEADMFAALLIYYFTSADVYLLPG